jgi:hypothetical protein
MTTEESFENEALPETPKVGWQKREFAVNGKMKEVIRLSVTATEAEIAGLRRKLQKLQYGG